MYHHDPAPGRTSPHMRGAVRLAVPVFVFSLFMLLALAPQPVVASCGGVTTVSNETQLNAAIAAFNAVAAGPCVFTIQLTGDIALTASTTAIDNTTAGVSLVIEGAGYTVDGGNILDVQVFRVAGGPVTVNAIEIANGQAHGNSGLPTTGGGIYQTGGDLTVTNSTFVSNEAAYRGGAIWSCATCALTVQNSTFYGNTANFQGGAIAAGGTAIIDSSTMATNQGGLAGDAIYVLAGGTVTMTNSILADGLGSHDCDIETGGTLSDGGHNFVQYPSTCAASLTGTGTILNQNPQLDPLADNGGPTRTMLPSSASPAIDAGGTTLTTDQRGVARPQGAADDIGAVEVAATCPAFPVAVANEGQLNSAIGCFNAKTAAGTYTINVTKDIALTASTTAINNATAGVSLVIEGAGYTVDGGQVKDVQVFRVAGGQVTVNAIEIARGWAFGTSGPNSGGGIHQTGGDLTVTNSTFTENLASRGGAIWSCATCTLTVQNSTFNQNTGNRNGGAIAALGTASIDSSTLADNQSINGDQLWVANGATVTVTNSIFAVSTLSDDCNIETGGTLIDGGHNLVQKPGNCAASLTGAGTILNQDPQLNPLADNGGPTRTMLLQSSSLAINAGATTLTTDQRGEPRPAGPADDIGAFESQVGSLTIVKKTSGGDGTFSYSSPQLGPFRLTTQKKTAQRTFAGLNPGAYNVSETPTRGWDLTNAICSNGSNPASITVGRGEQVICSFTNVQRGSITVVKNSAGGDGVFPFTSTALGSFALVTVGGTTQRAFDNLVAGTYDLSESVPAGWAQSGASCDDGSTLPNVNVAPGETVTCTFANARQGSLTVVKQATGADATFPFASTALGAFDLTTVNGTAQRTFANLNPGAYDLAENLPSGWQQTSATCSDGSTLPTVDVGAGEDVTCTFANAQVDTILVLKLALGGDDTFSFTSTALGAFTMTTSSSAAAKAFSGLTPGTYDIAESATPGWTMAEADPTCSNGDKASAVTLGTGETVLCLFANYKPDTIIVEKRTVGGDGAFGFTSNLPGAGSFSLTTVNGTVSRSFSGLTPGTYNIAETPQAGWAQTGARCDDGSTPDSIDLAAGATVRCVFTDTKLSSITVVKTTTGGDGSFGFTGSLGSFSLSTVSGTAQRLFANVLGGSYRISETVPAGWRLTGAGCADGSNPASITLAPGKDVTCTFANTKGGSLAVVVNTTDGNGSFGFTSTALGDFAVTTSGGTGQKAFANLAPGVYDLNEVVTSGWDLGLASCSNGSNPASVSVAAGESVTCTFENTHVQTMIFFPLMAKQ